MLLTQLDERRTARDESSNLFGVGKAGDFRVGYWIDLGKIKVQGKSPQALKEGFHHQKTVFTVGVVLVQTLNDIKALLAIKVLSGCVLDANLENERVDRPCAQGVLDVQQKAFCEAAAAVLGCDTDRCEVSRSAFVDHHKREADRLVIFGHDPVGKRRRLAQKKIERVPRVAVSVRKTSSIQQRYIAKMPLCQRPDDVFTGWGYFNLWHQGACGWPEQVLYRVYKLHYFTNIQSP